jgi:hypothetical protein
MTDKLIDVTLTMFRGATFSKPEEVEAWWREALSGFEKEVRKETIAEVKGMAEGLKDLRHDSPETEYVDSVRRGSWNAALDELIEKL